MNYANTSKYYNPAIYIWLLTITAMVLLIIVIGGLTRLTDSGLSMTDWRPILGIIPPLSLESWLIVFEMYKQTPEYKIVNKNMTLNEFKYITYPCSTIASPLFKTTVSRSITLDLKEIEPPSFHISVLIVSPGKTGDENLS